MTMKIGLSPDAIRPARGLVALAARIEDAGFDSVWVPDHIAFFGSPVVDPFQALTAFAAGTTSLELGTSVLVLPLRAPALVAKGAASLDYVSEGRLVLGVGVGGEFPGEYEAAGVPLMERGRRMDEALAVVRQLWSGTREPFAGRFYSIRKDTRLNPLPHRVGGPPLWVGGRAEAAIRRAARAGDGYLGFLLDPAGFAKRMTRVRALAVEHGRDGNAIAGALVTFAHVGEDGEAAVRAVTERLEANYGVPMREAVERYGIVGDFGTCVERARAFAAAGVEHLVLAAPFRGVAFDAALPELARLAAAVRND
jgi:probable F420-dependent oxidoreductase